jgi:hypothetical protein
LRRYRLCGREEAELAEDLAKGTLSNVFGFGVLRAGKRFEFLRVSES